MRGTTIDGPSCPSCSTALVLEDGSCERCGVLPTAIIRPSVRTPAPPTAPGKAFSWGDALIPCAIGGALAPLFSLGTVLGYMGWFLASLVHELGHCVLSWFIGTPAIPTISLGGHAAAAHGLQIPLLCYLIWGSLAVGVYILRDRGSWPFICALGALAYPAIAFTSLGETTFLLSGHVSELVFAAIFLHRSIVGGVVTGSRIERVLAALISWHLFARNLRLSGGILWDESIRQWYSHSGSFGLTNDYLRVADDLLHIPLERVAAGMFILSCLTLLTSLGTAIGAARRGA